MAVGKILIADDLEVVLKLEEILLRRTGCDVIKAKNGAEALKKVQAESPDIVLLDLLMPEMNGDVVCKFIKSNEKLAHITVIMVTGKDGKEDAERCKRAGCDYYLTKPIKQNELLSIVRKVMDEKGLVQA
jgi:two-component system, cell cycle response regulator